MMMTDILVCTMYGSPTTDTTHTHCSRTLFTHTGRRIISLVSSSYLQRRYQVPGSCNRRLVSREGRKGGRKKEACINLY